MIGSLQKRGKYWHLRVDVGIDFDTGKRIQKSISTKCTTKPEAEKARAKIINEINNNEFISRDDTLFSTMLDTWMDVHARQNCAQTTIEGYETTIEKYIKPYFKNIKVQDLLPIHIQDYYTFLLRKGKRQSKGGLSANSVRKHHIIISQVLNYALKMQIVTRNVADAVILPKINKYKGKIYNNEELKKLFEIIKGDLIESPVILAATLGLRRGEVLGLMWEHINFDNKTVNICNTRTKIIADEIEKDTKNTSSTRLLPMPNITYQYLKQLQRDQKAMKLMCGAGYTNDGYVCCYPDGNKMKVDYISQRFKNIIKNHNLPHIRFHDLRHSNATMLIQNSGKDSITMKWISEWLGHSTISTTMDIYAHVTHEMKEEFASKVDKILNISM